MSEGEGHLRVTKLRRDMDKNPLATKSEPTMEPLPRQSGLLSYSLGLCKAAVARLRRHRHLHGSWRNTVAHFCQVIVREGSSGLRERAVRFKRGGGDYEPEPAESYQRWIAKFDTLGDAKRARISDDVAGWSDRPVISIVLMLGQTVDGVRETIDAVARQIYPHWALTIVVGAGAPSGVVQLAKCYTQEDPRFSMVSAPGGSDEEASINLAIRQLTSGFVAFPCVGDTYAADAFYWVARGARLHPDALLFYGDADIAERSGVRRWPFFKPEWDPLLILGLDFVSDCAFISSEAVRQASGLRMGAGDAARYDLVLRVACVVSGANVVHVPRIMVHLAQDGLAGKQLSVLAQGRAHIELAPSAGLDAYLDGAATAVVEQLARTGRAARVTHVYPGLPLRRITYSVPQDPPHVTIIVPTRDGLSLLRRCIDSVIGKTSYPRYDVIIVDNGSTDPSTLTYFAELSSDPRISVFRDDQPFNFSAINNRAASEAKGQFLCLLNNDIEVISPDWLGVMIGHGVQPGVGAVGACLWYPDETLQHGGVLLGYGGVAGHLHHMLARGRIGYFGRAVVNQRLSAVTAACLLVSKAVYEEVGGLDESLAVAFNDIDFCIRIRSAGYANVWTPDAQLYHFESASRGTDMAPEKFARFQSEVRSMRERWGKLLDSDPAYNPNLNLSSALPQFALSDPPRAGSFDEA